MKIFFLLFASLSFFSTAQADLLQCKLGSLKGSRDQVITGIDKLILQLKEIQTKNIKNVQIMNQKALAFSKTDPLGTQKLNALRSKSLEAYDKFADDNVLGLSLDIGQIPYVKALQDSSNELKDTLKRENDRMVKDINSQMDAVNKKINGEVNRIQGQLIGIKDAMNENKFNKDYVSASFGKGMSSFNKKYPSDGTPNVGIKITPPRIDLCDFENIDSVLAGKYKELEAQVKALPEQIKKLMKETMKTIIINAAVQSGVVQQVMEAQTMVLCIPQALTGMVSAAGAEAVAKSASTCLNKDVVGKERKEKADISNRATTVIFPGGFVNVPFLNMLSGAKEEESDEISKKKQSAKVIANCLATSLGDGYKRVYDLCVSGKGSSDIITAQFFKDFKFGFNTEFKKIKQQKCILAESGQRNGSEMFSTQELVDSVFSKDNLPPAWKELGAQSYQDNYNSLVFSIDALDKTMKSMIHNTRINAYIDPTLSLPGDVYSNQKMNTTHTSGTKTASEIVADIKPTLPESEVTLETPIFQFPNEYSKAGSPVKGGVNGSDTTQRLLIETKFNNVVSNYKNAVSLYNTALSIDDAKNAIEALSNAGQELDIVIKAKITELYTHSYYFPRIDQTKINVLPLVILPSYKQTHIDPYNDRDPDFYLNRLKNLILHERNIK